MNRGFVDGNRRVAYACLELFLGIDVAASNDELENFIYGNLEAGTFRKDVPETWLKQHNRPLA